MLRRNPTALSLTPKDLLGYDEFQKRKTAELEEQSTQEQEPKVKEEPGRVRVQDAVTRRRLREERTRGA